MPVLGVVGPVGVGRSIQIAEVVVGGGSGVVVADQHGNRGSGGPAFEHAGQDLCPVGFSTLAGEVALARATAVQVGLQVVSRQGQARRTAIDHDADPGAMALAPSAEAEGMSEGASHKTSIEVSRLSIRGGFPRDCAAGRSPRRRDRYHHRPWRGSMGA